MVWVELEKNGVVGVLYLKKKILKNLKINYEEFLNYYKKACDVLGINFEMLKKKSENNIFNKELISDKFKPGCNFNNKS